MSARRSEEKFEIYEDAQDEYRWRFKASNGEIIADSAEGYTNKSDCRKGIRIVKKEAPEAKVEDKT